MALTHELKSKQSPVRQFLEDTAPHLLLAGSRGRLGNDIAREFRFDQLMARELAAPMPEGVTDKRAHAAPVGTAFDYRARMMLSSFSPGETVAMTGLQHFQENTKGIRRGKHMARVLTDAFELSRERAERGTEEDRDRLAVVLAWCESFYRAGVHAVVEGSLGKQLRRAEGGAALLESIEPLMLSDLATLRRAVEPQIVAWRTEIEVGARFEPNPVFTGSGMVGGADADWMIGDTLIDCKATEQISNPWIRNALFQLLGYALLDFEDTLQIRRVAIWLPRRAALQVWSLDQLLQKPADEDLPVLRERFKDALEVWHQQLAEEARARREAWQSWREAYEAEREAQAKAELARAEERKARRREADRERRAARKAAANEGLLP